MHPQRTVRLIEEAWPANGIVTSDAELRQLHESTMSALVRGAHQAIPDERGQRSKAAKEGSTTTPVRKATRKAR